MSAEKFDPFVSEWISFSKNPNYNLIEKCLKMAQILEYPELDISKYIEKINTNVCYFEAEQLSNTQQYNEYIFT